MNEWDVSISSLHLTIHLKSRTEEEFGGWIPQDTTLEIENTPPTQGQEQVISKEERGSRLVVMLHMHDYARLVYRLIKCLYYILIKEYTIQLQYEQQ